MGVILNKSTYLGLATGCYYILANRNVSSTKVLTPPILVYK